MLIKYLTRYNNLTKLLIVNLDINLFKGNPQTIYKEVKNEQFS